MSDDLRDQTCVICPRALLPGDPHGGLCCEHRYDEQPPCDREKLREEIAGVLIGRPAPATGFKGRWRYEVADAVLGVVGPHLTAAELPIQTHWREQALSAEFQRDEARAERDAARAQVDAARALLEGYRGTNCTAEEALLVLDGAAQDTKEEQA